MCRPKKAFLHRFGQTFIDEDLKSQLCCHQWIYRLTEILWWRKEKASFGSHDGHPSLFFSCVHCNGRKERDYWWPVKEIPGSLLEFLDSSGSNKKRELVGHILKKKKRNVMPDRWALSLLNRRSGTPLAQHIKREKRSRSAIISFISWWGWPMASFSFFNCVSRPRLSFSLLKKKTMIDRIPLIST